MNIDEEHANGNNMKTIQTPMECLDFCEDALRKAKQKVAKTVYDKYGDSVEFPMFLSVDLCNAMNSVFVCAPSREEAFRFIQQALDIVSERTEEK